MRPDGTDERLVAPKGCTGDSASARRPAWAPNGRRLIFEFTPPPTADTQLTLADADGTDRAAVPLAPPPSAPEQGRDFDRSDAAFAPDGRRFVYQRYFYDGSPPEIWLAAVDGSEDRRLLPGRLARWSPDGRTIAYVPPTENPDTDEEREHGTWLMSARTGKRLRRVWGHSAQSLDWAPDGRRLVASRSGEGVRILRRDGKGTRRLVRSRAGRAADGQAVWSPDGRRISFVRLRSVPDGGGESGLDVEIWTIGTRGTRARRIWTRHHGFDSDSSLPTLSWQPVPR